MTITAHSRRDMLSAALGTTLVAVLGPLDLVAAETRPAPMVVAGAGANLAAIRLLAAAYAKVRADVGIEVPASIGSTGALRAAADGAIALGLVARRLRERERTLGLTVVPYARTPVVIGAHPTVADDGIASDDLVQIHLGKRTRWRDGREIVVLTREPGDSTIEVLQDGIPGFKEAFEESHRAKRWIVLFTDQQMAQTLARTPQALGFSDTGAITAERLPLKILKVDGVLPTPENVTSGKYRLVKTLSFAVHPDKLSPEAKRFMDFVRSPDGVAILRANGYLPGT